VVLIDSLWPVSFCRSLAWLNKHCAERFGVTPEPRALADLWGFDRLNLTGASKILFTNGMTDGWSVGGITTNLSDTLVAINIADGAHHSDLSHQVPSDADTPAVVAARQQALGLLQAWCLASTYLRCSPEITEARE